VTGPAASNKLAFTAIAAGMLGGALAITGFYVTIIAALDGTGTRPGVGPFMFFAGAAINLAGFVLAVVALVRSDSKRMPGLALAVTLLPAALLVAIFVAART
jgi:hypothetical protein